MTKDLTHFTKSGDAHMVDIHDKDITSRTAVASGKINMSAASIKKIKEGSHKKGMSWVLQELRQSQLQRKPLILYLYVIILIYLLYLLFLK